MATAAAIFVLSLVIGSAVTWRQARRDGASGITLARSSGSDDLAQAAEALVRNAHLPPFPPDMKLPKQSVTLPSRYSEG